MTYGYYQPQYTPNYFSNQNYNPQPVIQQPQNSNKMTLVSNREEATGATVDLINGTPSFFYNKSNGEIYLKQFDVQNGTAIFKTYIQAKETPEEPKEGKYIKEFEYLKEGMAGLYRKLDQFQPKTYIEDIEEIKAKGKKNA